MFWVDTTVYNWIWLRENVATLRYIFVIDCIIIVVDYIAVGSIIFVVDYIDNDYILDDDDDDDDDEDDDDMVVSIVVDCIIVGGGGGGDQSV
eukprot:10177147-Ditylum_brightwellii.AAC.1